MALVTLRGVALRHPAAQAAVALRGLDLSIEPGETLAVIGPSGSGKTTLLHGLALALKPLEGELRLFGTVPGPRPDHSLRARLFLAPQTPPLPPRQRVVTAVLAGALPQWGLFRSLRSLCAPVDVDGARRALARFELADKLFERVDRISGGERQRVGLARAIVALAAGAELLLIDEPLSALDPTRAAQAIGALMAAAQERGAALVCSLHQVDIALARFPRIVGLRQGRVLFDLPAAQVSDTLLRQLYADHEHELQGPAAPVVDAPAVASGASDPQVMMICR